MDGDEFLCQTLSSDTAGGPFERADPAPASGGPEGCRLLSDCVEMIGRSLAEAVRMGVVGRLNSCPEATQAYARPLGNCPVERDKA